MTKAIDRIYITDTRTNITNDIMEITDMKKAKEKLNFLNEYHGNFFKLEIKNEYTNSKGFGVDRQWKAN